MIFLVFFSDFLYPIFGNIPLRLVCFLMFFVCPQSIGRNLDFSKQSKESAMSATDFFP